jgi:hypothetical protein
VSELARVPRIGELLPHGLRPVRGAPSSQVSEFVGARSSVFDMECPGWIDTEVGWEVPEGCRLL